MNTYQPFTYLVGWSQLDRWYYGVRYAEGCSPSDLWDTYFTSSQTVKEFRVRHGEPDIVQVRRTFSDGRSAYEWEFKVISRMKMLWSDRWLNKGLCGMSDRRGKRDSEETRMKKSLSKKGVKIPKEVTERRSVAMKGKRPPEYLTTKGHIYSAESRSKMSAKRLAYIERLASEGKRMACYDAERKPISEDARRKISEKSKEGTKISLSQVAEIRATHDEQHDYDQFLLELSTRKRTGKPFTYSRFISKRLAPIYQVSPNQIHNIVTRKTRT